MTGGTAIAVAPPRGPTLEYTVTAVVPDLAPADLIGRGRYYPRDVARRYLELPFPLRPQGGGPEAAAEWRAAAASLPAGREWVDLYALNERIVGGDGPVPRGPGRGAVPAHHYEYSLRPPSAGYDSPYAAFLFATRSRVLPALRRRHGRAPPLQRHPRPRRRRLHPGKEERSGEWVVSRNDAHSWVEAYFPGVGWAPFDPTPGRRIPSTGDAPTNGPDARRRGRGGRRRGVTRAVGRRP